MSSAVETTVVPPMPHEDLFEALPVALLRVDRAGAVVRANVTARRLLGLATETAGARDLAAQVAFVAADGRPLPLDALAAGCLQAAPGSMPETVVACRPDGSALTLEVTAAPSWPGEPGDVLLVLHDASARCRAEAAAREARERMDRTEEIAHLGSWELDLEQNRLRWSDGVYRLFGLRPQEFGATYEAFLEAVHPDDRAAVDEAFSMSLRRGGLAYEIEHRIVRRSDGEVRVVHERCEHARDADGRVIRSFGMVHDVTDRWRAEEALRERTGRLAQADRIKDEFLATLSHELRTPLSTILVWAHLLVHTDLDEASRRHAQEVILSSASTQKEIIDEVLDVSRIISGKMALNVSDVAVEVVLAAALDVVRPAASAKRLRLEVHAEPGLVVLGDGARLQQVLWNLLANAVKFSEEGGSVRVEASRSGASVRVSVGDSGIGIAPAFLPHVFDRFTQQDSSPARQYGGLGLGLAIARHLVELHGGTIEAESAGSGQGARFTVLLPARNRRGRRAPAPAVKGPAAPPRLAGARLLVVDDEPDAREVTAEVLRRAGASVTLAGSSAEALERLRAQAHDALVADIAMPGTDGYVLIREVRRLPGAAGRIPAVALTAHTRESDRRQAMAAGFDRHLGKPATPGEVVEALATLLRARS